MTPEQSKKRIDNAADFAFYGQSRSYMEVELDDDMCVTWTYVVYGYGWRGQETDLPLNQLTDDVTAAIRRIKGRVAVVWRRDPQIRYEESNRTTYASVRLAIIDENLKQIDLDIEPIREGELYPLLNDES